jgi:hypothetical protein
MGDDNLMAALRQGIAEIDSGEGVSWEQVKRELDL